MKRAQIALALAGSIGALQAPGAALAQSAPAAPAAEQLEEEQEPLGKPSFTVEPVVLDSAENDDVTLGVQYAFTLKAPLASLAASTSDDFGDVDKPAGRIEFHIDSSGTIATSADRNPKNFLDAAAGIDGTYFFGPALGWVSLGGLFKYETDQKFEKEQTVLGGRVTWVKSNLFVRNDTLALDVGYGKVDPSEEDQDRKTALGVTELDPFDRIDFEAWYLLPTGSKWVRAIEFNYRLYREVDAPAAINAADLDSFELVTVRAKLPNNLFVAYSKGRLPFDKTDDKIFELGLSYDFF